MPDEEPLCEACILAADEYEVLGRGDGGPCPEHRTDDGDSGGRSSAAAESSRP